MKSPRNQPTNQRSQQQSAPWLRTPEPQNIEEKKKPKKRRKKKEENFQIPGKRKYTHLFGLLMI